VAVRPIIRGNETLLLLGLLLVLPTFVFPTGIIRGFDIETQPVYLFQQDLFHKIALLFPCLSALFLFFRRKVIASPVTVFCHATLAMMFCIYIVFLYFRFHFAKPDPTWVVLPFLVGYTFLFMANLKNLFFPYEYLRAYQPGLPVRLQRPPSPGETWGTILLLLGTLIGFQGYYARSFLGKGPQYLLIIAGTFELTPTQRVQAMLGIGLAACLSGTIILLWPKKQRHRAAADAA
jgi:hypothetical protein